MPLVSILAGMESAGIAINKQVLSDQVPAMTKRMEQLAQQAAVYNRGVRFDLARNAKGVLSRLLFGTQEAGGLGLQPPVGIKRSRCGAAAYPHALHVGSHHLQHGSSHQTVSRVYV
eukprot:GHUV01045536.1.p1 GENE.GHUV01045536.1~~GHUV01045536.1.p1  ORF type:complete len:116 (+),score=44.11 GHUV01045536.1:153-500(+)